MHLEQDCHQPRANHVQSNWSRAAMAYSKPVSPCTAQQLDLSYAAYTPLCGDHLLVPTTSLHFLTFRYSGLPNPFSELLVILRIFVQSPSQI
jgi:hypothetical protein